MPVKHSLRTLFSALILFIALVRLQADAVDDYIHAEMKNSRIPGLSLAVVRNGRLIKSAGYGLSNVETATRATAETAYKVASLSKPIIATAVMLLAQQGKLSLDGKVARYLSGAPSSWQSITIKHLLTHTSGMPRDPADYHPYSEQQPAVVVGSAYSMPLEFQPGQKWLYSNIGYYVLAEIVSKVTGIPWSDFVAKLLFEPAGLTSTRLTSVSAIIPNRARGYEVNQFGLFNAEDWIAARPSGAYVSTVSDLAKLDIFLDSRSPLDASSRAAMKTPVRLLDGRTAAYGLGWKVDSYLGQKRISHDGQVWDEAEKAVFKQSRSGQNFSAGESRTYEFTWTPARAGKYTVNLGVYGPKWMPSYSWHQGMAILTVE